MIKKHDNVDIVSNGMLNNCVVAELFGSCYIGFIGVFKLKKNNQIIQPDYKELTKIMENKLKQNRGGARKGAGRKPIKDKKKPVTLFVKESIINLHGIDNLKEKLYAAL